MNMSPLTHEQLSEYILSEREHFYRIAYSYVQNAEDAMDIIQEAAIKALRALPSLKNPQYYKTWFHRILINTALDTVRKSKKYALTDTWEAFENPIEDHYTDYDLRAALDALPYEQRIVIVLHYFEDMKLADIADILNININTVKTRLYAGLRKLRFTIKEEDYE